jgi:hypothetical protein
MQPWLPLTFALLRFSSKFPSGKFFQDRIEDWIAQIFCDFFMTIASSGLKLKLTLISPDGKNLANFAPVYVRYYSAFT